MAADSHIRKRLWHHQIGRAVGNAVNQLDSVDNDIVLGKPWTENA